MEQVMIPPAWVESHAPVATLLPPLVPHWAWWATASGLLVAALLLPRRRQTHAVAVAALAAIALALAGDGLVDDAYIQFRYAAHLAAGHGPVFNPGERLEGASGGVWIAAVAGVSRLARLEPGVAGRLLSLALAPVAVLLAGAAAARLAPGSAAPVAVAWAALATPALYAASGLETAAWGMALWLLAAGLARRTPGLAAAGGALGAGVRPESLVLTALAVPFWGGLPRAARAAVAGAATVIAALAAARLLYYGSPVPHAALVKGVTAAAGPEAGIRYFLRGLLEWWPLLLALPAIWRRHREALPVLLPVLGWTVLVVARGGDWMPASRYLLPLLVLLAVALSWSSSRVQVVAAALLVATAAWRLAPWEEPGRARPGDLWRAMATHRVQCRWWEALGAWLKDHLPAGTRLAVGPAGAVPYASGLPTFDLYGLNTRVQRQGGVTPGHTLWGLPEAVAEGCAVVVPGRPLSQSEDLEEAYRAARAEAARAPALAELYRPVLLLHPSPRSFDIRRDLIWVRDRPTPGDPVSLDFPSSSR